MTPNTTFLDPQATESGANFGPELRQAIESELEAICSDPQFGSSSRNCAFLRYVVTETLEGRATEIKERTIGTEVFGRPASYDTGSDSVVRVRANDIRKRLTCYYEERSSRSGWRIQMPLRSYVPRFLPESRVEAPETLSAASKKAGSPAVARSFLSLSQMMMPTLVALFLCAATFRWQVFSGTPYLDFWNSLLAGRSEITLVLDTDPADPHAVTMDDLKAINPLLQTAVSFHATGQAQSAASSRPDSTTIVPIHITHHSSPNASPLQEDPHEAHVTVIPGKHPEIWIDGASPAAIELAIHSITDADIFPYAFDLAIHRGTPSRISIAENRQVRMQSVAAGHEL